MVDADMEEQGLQPSGEGARILAEKSPEWHQWKGSVTSLINASDGSALG